MKLKKAVAYRTISKDYQALTRKERDLATGCSVCQQDQVVIQLPNIRPFKFCKHLAKDLTTTLQQLLAQGAAINELIGYRVGMTRGRIDQQGNRTGFSNHSFGTAIDINPQQNGLYANCFQFGPQCKKLRGGDWRPGIDPFSLKHEGLIVKTLKRLGLKWGGEIQGRQKDFMHFSMTGY
ncbi:MAG: M15 family metallopeptidase [Thioalkalispiraceae bacterium]